MVGKAGADSRECEPNFSEAPSKAKDFPTRGPEARYLRPAVVSWKKAGVLAAVLGRGGSGPAWSRGDPDGVDSLKSLAFVFLGRCIPGKSCLSLVGDPPK